MKVKRSRFDVFINTAVLILLVGVGIYIAYMWNTFPSRIPSHYNMAGEIDKMSSKSTVWVVYLVGCILSAGLFVVEQFPAIWNTGVEVNEKNKEMVYRTLKTMLETMRFTIVIVFSIITLTALHGKELPVYALPFFLLVVFGFLSFFIIRLCRKSKTCMK